MARSTKTNFTFINLSHPDELKERSTIDQIRCTAMSNFGAVRRRRNIKVAKNETVFEVQSPEPIPASKVAFSRAIRLEEPNPIASCTLTSCAYEIALCQNVCAANELHSLALRSAWSSVAFFDELSFQSVLSNAALFDQMLRSGQLVLEDTAQSLRFHNKALEMINKRLDDPRQHTSSSLIGCLCGVLTHDYIIGEYKSWNGHMSGLLKMIALRGGVKGLSEQLHIVLSWTDISGSFSQDMIPHLPLSPSWSQPVLESGYVSSVSPNDSTIPRIWESEISESHPWITIYKNLWDLLSNPTKPPNTWLEPVLHSLLSLRSLQSGLSPTRASIIEEMCRLGTLLFLAPIWRSFGSHPVRTFAFRRKVLLTSTNYLIEWGELRVLLLWTLAHAAREAESEKERDEFVLRLAMVASLMGLDNWWDIVEKMKTVLWVGAPEGIWQLVRDGVEEMLQLRGVEGVGQAMTRIQGDTETTDAGADPVPPSLSWYNDLEIDQ